MTGRIWAALPGCCSPSVVVLMYHVTTKSLDRFTSCYGKKRDVSWALRAFRTAASHLPHLAGAPPEALTTGIDQISVQGKLWYFPGWPYLFSKFCMARYSVFVLDSPNVSQTEKVNLSRHLCKDLAKAMFNATSPPLSRRSVGKDILPHKFPSIV